MLAEERRALGAATGEVLLHVTSLVEGVHDDLADVVYGAVPGAAPVRVVHRVISRAVHLTVGRGGRALVRGAGAVGGLLPDRGEAWTSTPGGGTTQAILNGIVGDLLVDQDNDLAIRMAVRHDRHDVPLTDGDVAAVFPDAGPRVAVHLHGLTEDEGAFGWLAERHGVRPRHEELLDDLGITPVFVRYNSGLRISENGLELAALLARLDRVWPVPVEEFVLVGHSMGGLVLQSAVVLAAEVRESWVERTRHLVALSSPVHGAGLERVVHRGTVAGAERPVARAVARFLNLRSVGIKDLRHGTIDESWRGVHPDEPTDDRRTVTRLPDHVRLHSVGATLSRTTSSGLARRLGDGLVTPASARGIREQGWVLEPDTHLDLTSSTHWDVLNHPDVTTHLKQVLW